MESETDSWDDYVHIYTVAHNKSTNVHGYSPEGLHLRYSNAHRTQLMGQILKTPISILKILSNQPLPVDKKLQKFEKQNKEYN